MSRQPLTVLAGTGVRRALYPLLALPVGIVCLVLVLVGKAGTAASLQRRFIHRLLAVPVAAPTGRQVATHSLVSLPVNTAAFVLAAYLWLVPVLNLGYPLRPDTDAESLRDAWGGPTLAGAWAVHAVGALLIFVLVGLPILTGIAWLQGRLARRMLGA